MSHKLENFERAFDAHSGGCHRQCECGRVFYNSDGGWTFEDGELERLNADKNATDLPYSVGTLIFEGRHYVPDCDCWKARAERIIEWIDNHADGIASYLTLEKRRKQDEADRAPIVQ